MSNRIGNFVYDEILKQIQSREIECIDMEATDTEGYCCDAVYKVPRMYGQEEFFVYLSAYCEDSYEEQAAKQIFEQIEEETLERELGEDY